MYNFYTILYIFYVFIQLGLSQEVKHKNIVKFDEGSKLQMQVYDLKRSDYYSCGESRCESEGKPTLELSCTIVEQTEGHTSIQYINATTKTIVSAEHVGIWHCTFILQYDVTQNERKQKKDDKKEYNVTFKLSQIKQDESTDPKWIYIGSVLGILAVIVVVQTGCILYFKKKARGKSRIESLQPSVTVDSPDNAVRYTKMPGQIRMEQMNKEPRDSASDIYEALENFPVPKPEPPPIDTLPRFGKGHKEAKRTKLTSKTLPPPTAKKPKQKKTSKNTDKHQDEEMSMSSLNRIKARKPQPLPIEEPPMYEVMSPPDSLKKSGSGPNRTQPGKKPLLAQAVPIFPTGNNVPMLPSMIAAAQLKPVNKSNQKAVSTNKVKQQPNPEPKVTKPYASNAYKMTHEAPQAFRKPPGFSPLQPSLPVFRQPPAPLPIQPLPGDNGSISSDEDEWTYEPLSQYDNDYNIYNNVPR